jgi:environmental stress-induced protein Ves
MKILRAADYRRMPWKNGLGETAEIAVSPVEAPLDRFDWRVSMARVEAAGPFSLFAGIDRTLTVIDGAGLVLRVDGAPPVTLSVESDPHAFAADVPSSAVLFGGPVTDFNVMTRRGTCVHRVRALAVQGSVSLHCQAPDVLLFCAAGRVRITGPAMDIALGPRDTACGGAETTDLVVLATEPAKVLVVEIGSAPR